MRHLRPAPFASLIACLAATIVLAACGSSGEDAELASGGEGATIAHKFGKTTVPKDPTRVVTVGWNDQDYVLPLGTVPVTTRAWFDIYNDLPWVKQATGGRGVKSMGGDGIDFEAVAAAKPQVIFAIYETIDRKTYNRLAKIAPTVIQSSKYKDEETPWDVHMTTTGEALGKEAEAEKLVKQVDDKIAKAKREHPEFAGKTLVMDYGPENGGHYLIGKGDPRRALFDALGFDAQPTVGDLSEEKVNLMDEDVLFITGATKAQMAKSPAFSRLDAVKGNRAIYTTFESPLAGALSYSGPDSLDYALDVLVPQLSRAIKGQSAGNVEG